MDWGLKNRLSSIIKPQNNRALMLAVDHGYFLGPTEKLEDPKKVIAPLLKYCDSLMLTRGVQRTSVPATTPTPMVLESLAVQVLLVMICLKKTLPFLFKMQLDSMQVPWPCLFL